VTCALPAGTRPTDMISVPISTTATVSLPLPQATKISSALFPIPRRSRLNRSATMARPTYPAGPAHADRLLLDYSVVPLNVSGQAAVSFAFRSEMVKWPVPGVPPLGGKPTFTNVLISSHLGHAQVH
jgi:hypothetical protein